VRISTVIVDNGSDNETTAWIRRQPFTKATLLKTNVGIAKALDILWHSCGAAPYILNVEDDWVLNPQTPSETVREAMRILDSHDDVLEVWLRPHAAGFQFAPGTPVSINGHFMRTLMPTASEPFWYYLQTSSKTVFPYWGQYTNGASLKHAQRLRSIGPMYQPECGDMGNCESEFTAKTAYLGLKAARLCWRGDKCDAMSDNEPVASVMFAHLVGDRSPGHTNPPKKINI